MQKIPAPARSQRSSFRNIVLPLTISLIAQVAALTAPVTAQAAANTFAIATRYGEIVCTSELAKNRKILELSSFEGAEQPLYNTYITLQLVDIPSEAK